MTWIPTLEAREVFQGFEQLSFFERGSHNLYGLDHYTHNILLG